MQKELTKGKTKVKRLLRRCYYNPAIETISPLIDVLVVRAKGRFAC